MILNHSHSVKIILRWCFFLPFPPLPLSSPKKKRQEEKNPITTNLIQTFSFMPFFPPPLSPQTFFTGPDFYVNSLINLLFVFYLPPSPPPSNHFRFSFSHSSYLNHDKNSTIKTSKKNSKPQKLMISFLKFDILRMVSNR